MHVCHSCHNYHPYSHLTNFTCQHWFQVTPDCASSGRVCSLSLHTVSDYPIHSLLVWIFSATMEDPSVDHLSVVDARVISQTCPSLSPSIRPFIQMPSPGSLPSSVAFVTLPPLSPFRLWHLMPRYRICLHFHLAPVD